LKDDIILNIVTPSTGEDGYNIGFQDIQYFMGNIHVPLQIFTKNFMTRDPYSPYYCPFGAEISQLNSKIDTQNAHVIITSTP